jgi:hypothetical protein
VFFDIAHVRTRCDLFELGNSLFPISITLRRSSRQRTSNFVNRLWASFRAERLAPVTRIGHPWFCTSLFLSPHHQRFALGANSSAPTTKVLCDLLVRSLLMRLRAPGHERKGLKCAYFDYFCFMVLLFGFGFMA